MVAMSIFRIVIIAANARLASAPPAAMASVSARGVICHDRPQRSLHQPHSLYFAGQLNIHSFPKRSMRLPQ